MIRIFWVHNVSAHEWNQLTQSIWYMLVHFAWTAVSVLAAMDLQHSAVKAETASMTMRHFPYWTGLQCNGTGAHIISTYDAVHAAKAETALTVMSQFPDWIQPSWNCISAHIISTHGAVRKVKAEMAFTAMRHFFWLNTSVMQSHRRTHHLNTWHSGSHHHCSASAVQSHHSNPAIFWLMAEVQYWNTQPHSVTFCPSFQALQYSHQLITSWNSSWTEKEEQRLRNQFCERQKKIEKCVSDQRANS